MQPRPPRSPASALLLGLVVTLAMVIACAGYISWQIAGLRALQTNLADRNRQESLQLLRIQDDLNQLALAMRDMLDGTTTYPLVAWSSQFERIRGDLDTALRRHAEIAVAQRTPEEMTYLTRSVSQFWDAVDRIFALAAGGHDAEARLEIQESLQARQAALSSAVARLLVRNNASEERMAQQVQEIYERVEQRVYLFLGGTIVAIAATGLLLIRSNRRVFARLAALSDERRDLARQLMTTREATLRDVSRELHDEFGQLLTAMGSMLTRAGRHAPDASPLRAELREVNVIAQEALDKVRGLSQALHPSILEELGLDSAIESYLSNVERQLGLQVSYQRSGPRLTLDPATSIQVYRVLQEALTNVARHAQTTAATVSLTTDETMLELVISDRGGGIKARDPGRITTGVAGMRERAALAGGTLDIDSPDGQHAGTRVTLRVPIAYAA